MMCFDIHRKKASAIDFIAFHLVLETLPLDIIYLVTEFFEQFFPVIQLSVHRTW